MYDLYKKLIEYSEGDIYPFCMPGHKRQVTVRDMLKTDQSAPAGRNHCYGPNPEVDPYTIDITEVEGFDDLHRADGILKEITDKAEKIYKVPHAYMSVNGSTACNLAAVNAMPDEGRLLIAANCHPSVFNGAKLSNRKVVEIAPEWVGKCGIYGGLLPQNVENALKGYPDIRAVVITSPSYDGFISDVKSIAEIVHAHGAKLIVDEAHGAHLPFCKRLPESALYQGADIVVHSLHKTLGSLNQTAMAFVADDELAENFREKLLMVTTTSPSYVLMASIEAAVDWAGENRKRFEAYTDKLFELRTELKAFSEIGLIDDEMTGRYGITEIDKAKLLFSPEHMSGDELYMKFYNDHKLQFEKHGHKHALAMTTIFDTDEGFERLKAAAGKIYKNSQ